MCSSCSEPAHVTESPDLAHKHAHVSWAGGGSLGQGPAGDGLPVHVHLCWLRGESRPLLYSLQLRTCASTVTASRKAFRDAEDEPPACALTGPATTRRHDTQGKIWGERAQGPRAPTAHTGPPGSANVNRGGQGTTDKQWWASRVCVPHVSPATIGTRSESRGSLFV